LLRAVSSTIDLLPTKALIKHTMALDRLKQAAAHVAGLGEPPHPFDPLTEAEIEQAVAIVNKEHSGLFFNAVTLWEPRKAEMMAWLQDPQTAPRPHRVADVVTIGRGSKVYDGIVDLTEGKIVSWELTEGVQPFVCMLTNSIGRH
jgi:primary-amine oxidase